MAQYVFLFILFGVLATRVGLGKLFIDLSMLIAGKFSGGPAKGRKEILDEIQEIANGGGFGSIVGRNSFQRPFDEGLSLMREIMDIYKSA